VNRHPKPSEQQSDVREAPLGGSCFRDQRTQKNRRKVKTATGKIVAQPDILKMGKHFRDASAQIKVGGGVVGRGSLKKQWSDPSRAF